MRLPIPRNREAEWRTLIDEIHTTNKNLRALREEIDLLALWAGKRETRAQRPGSMMDSTPNPGPGGR